MDRAKRTTEKLPNQRLNAVPGPAWRPPRTKFFRATIAGVRALTVVVKASVVVGLAGLLFEFVRRKRKQNLETGNTQVTVPSCDVQGTPPDELVPKPTVLGNSWMVATRRFARNNAFRRTDGLLWAASAAGVDLSAERTEKLNNPIGKMVAETVDFTDSVKSIFQPGKANVFASYKDLVPVTFFGAQIHLFIKTGAMRPVPSPWLLPPTDTDTRRWSAFSGIKVHGDGTNPNSGVTVSTDCDIRWPGCLTYTMADIRCCDGHFNFEACTRFSDDRVHMSMVGQVANWSRLVAARYDVHYLWPYSTMSVSVKPKDHACSIQFLTSLTNRLTTGFKLAYKRDERCKSPWMDMSQFGVAMKFKYAGPSFIFSGKVASTDTACRLALYHHHSEWLQSGTMVELGPCHSTTTSRLAFRVMSDTWSSVFRVAVGTDGVINSLWEKRLDDHLSISLSTYVNFANIDRGAGIGLSFNY